MLMQPVVEHASSPARGTWIEMLGTYEVPENTDVVPRKGDVDRNITAHFPKILQKGVVPRKGDVDRNMPKAVCMVMLAVSSPARGTWIEMGMVAERVAVHFVVPRKGDVDRNCELHRGVKK